MRMRIGGVETAETVRHRVSSPAIVLRPIVFIGLVTCHGGDAVQMMELAAGIQARGHKVQIVVSDSPAAQKFAQRCRERKLSVECSPLIKADQHGEANQSPGNIVRLLCRFRNHTIHFHTGDLVLPRKVMIALRLIPHRDVFVTVHHPYDYLDPQSARARHWAASVRASVTAVICPSEHSYRIQRRLCISEDKLKLIRNGVDTLHYGHGKAATVRMCALSHLPEQAQILLFTARLEAEKGPAVALEAFQRIAPELPFTHFVFVGCGALQDQLRSAVPSTLQDRVHFVGFQTNIPDWLASATLWLHASETENCSMALLEALAAGCPTIATLCPGNDEVLEEGKNALTFAPGDSDKLADEMRRLLTDSRLRTALSMEARNTADRFSLQNMLAGHLTHCYR